MTSEPFKPDDLAFLISRSLDGDLSPAERRRLEEALARSESLRSEATNFEAVGRLVDRWGRKPAELDWKHHAALAAAQAACGGESAGKLDDLLRRWSRPSVEVEAVDLTTRVLAKIRSERRLSTPYRLILRWGMPLAAAAAIALAVTVTTWFSPVRDPISLVAIGPASRAASFAKSGIESRVVVSFVESAETAATVLSAPAIGFGTVGVEPEAAIGEESAPL